MSEISLIYDGIYSRLATLLSGHQKLPNPYNLAMNSEQFLDRGYGVTIGPMVNQRLFQSCKTAIQRQFGVVVTRSFIKRDFDTGPRETREKELLEDLALLYPDFYNANQLTATGASIKDFDSDNGVEFVFPDRENFIFINCTILINYFENFTPP